MKASSALCLLGLVGCAIRQPRPLVFDRGTQVCLVCPPGWIGDAVWHTDLSKTAAENHAQWRQDADKAVCVRLSK